MNTITRNKLLVISASTVLLGALALSATASNPNALLVPPDSNHLPRFGFSSFNIGGYGERITHVRYGGLAARLGLEPGDTILILNSFRLTYHGSWNDALHEAVHTGGYIRLRVRDVRTGRIVVRETYVGGGVVGPITPKFHHGGFGPNTSHMVVPGHNFGTSGRSTNQKFDSDREKFQKNLRQIAEIFSN